VTADQVKTVSQKYVDPAKSIVIAVGDRKAIGPSLGTLGLGTPELRDADGQLIGAPARATR
jgi:zinc protease